jgi:hypothetical protein
MAETETILETTAALSEPTTLSFQVARLQAADST